MDGASPTGQNGNWVASLKAFLGQDQRPDQRCELCGQAIGHDHAHLIEPGSHRMLCACPPCGLLFADPDARRYRRLPRRVKRLAGFALSDRQWDAFLIPINLAFFYPGADGQARAMYPGPAGATQSALDLAAWNDLVAANPVLQRLEPEAEALLVNRVGGAREYYQVPLDRCYALVGAIRSNWHGLSGGDRVREAIQTFFAGLRDETDSPEADYA